MIIHCFQTSSRRRYHIIGCDNNVVSKSLHLDFGRPTIQRCSYNLKLYTEEADLLFKEKLKKTIACHCAAVCIFHSWHWNDRCHCVLHFTYFIIFLFASIIFEILCPWNYIL